MLTLPNLDDRTFTDLVEEGLNTIRGIAPEWTNFNPSDPGITLIELFAYVTEALIYRLNQITDEDLEAYLKLLKGPDWQLAPDRDAAVEMRKAVLALNTPQRAVTPEDFEALALSADTRLARVHAVPDRDLWAPHRAPREGRPGHISVVVVPQETEGASETAAIVDSVSKFLEPRRLLATRLHVGPPRYMRLRIRLTLSLQPGASASYVRDEAVRVLARFFDPVSGGPDGRGWPFGRPVYVSEIYELLDAIPEVDFALPTNDPSSLRPLDEAVAPDGPASRVRRSAGGDVIAIRLDPDELIRLEIEEDDIRLAAPGRQP